MPGQFIIARRDKSQGGFGENGYLSINGTFGLDPDMGVTMTGQEARAVAHALNVTQRDGQGHAGPYRFEAANVRKEREKWQAERKRAKEMLRQAGRVA